MSDEIKAPPIVRDHVLRIIREENAAALSSVVTRVSFTITDELQQKILTSFNEQMSVIPDETVLKLALFDETVMRKAWRSGMERKILVELSRLMPEMDAMTEATLDLLSGRLFRGPLPSKEPPKRKLG